MSKNILVRDVPEAVDRWIEDQRYELKKSKQEFISDVLINAYNTEGKQISLFDAAPQYTPPDVAEIPFSFIDLFAGIGGFRIGLQNIGGKCVFTSEYDPHAQKTYRAWFGDSPHGDIRDISPKDIPDHDLLAAGFPCQPFSIAGVSKKQSLGREHGFKDKTQGTLFFYVLKIVEEKRPPVLFLENVKNLLSHDKKKTWTVIYKSLEELGYSVFFKVIDAKAYVPQHRERICIVCFDNNVFGENPPFEFPRLPEGEPHLIKNILEANPDPKYTLTDHLWKYLQDYAERHRQKGNGFGYGLVDLNGISRTISARYYKDGAEILIPQGKGKNPRRLTPGEAAKLMGFMDDLPIVVSDTQAYKQFGNAIVPLMVEDVGRQILKVLYWHITENGNKCLLKK